ncbi:hypothetical protein V2J09_022005 [Rumex salicifolius]
MIHSQGSGNFLLVVPKSLDGDEAMVDCDGDNRPPGHPPDKGGSWADKVAGDGRGGMPTPEMVLDDGFVQNRLKVTFPDGADGELDVEIGQEVLEAMTGLWKNCIYIKVLSRSVPLLKTQRTLEAYGGMNVVDLPRKFFMVRFDSDEDYFAALTGGP